MECWWMVASSDIVVCFRFDRNYFLAYSHRCFLWNAEDSMVSFNNVT